LIDCERRAVERRQRGRNATARPILIREADYSFEQESTRLTLPWKLDDVQMRKRAMPMLFWLPVIFMSVFLEMNGYSPEADEVRDQLAV
jgi:hypothetical protein